MTYPFVTYQMEVDGHVFWVAESQNLNGCVGQGDCVSQAVAELEENETEWLESARKYNIPIPKPPVRTEKTFSGKLSLRMSPFLHESASVQADFLGISLNQYITDAVAYYNSVVKAHYAQPAVSETLLKTV